MFELQLHSPEHRIDQLSDALEALAALSISVEDADAQTDAEQALYGEPGLPLAKQGWHHSRVMALYETRAQAAQSLASLQREEFFADCQVIGVQEIPDQDWVRLTQSQFAPVEILPHFWIVPSWHEPPSQAGISIQLDPGLAFGTGTHPTTKMCLRWVATYFALHPSETNCAARRVLDYGCGSGILAIAAAKFGATDIQAVDIDQAAIDTTRLNAQANQAALRAGKPDTISGDFQIVLANILATPLKVLAPLLWSRVAVSGNLILAGILERQVDELQVAYAPFCALEVADREDGWVLMCAKR